MCMVYPSGHSHLKATENLGICTSRGSHAIKDGQNALTIFDTVVRNFTIWNMASGHKRKSPDARSRTSANVKNYNKKILTC
jgi:hypothetical protein